MNNTIKNALRGALFFGAIAPPIGSVVYSLGLIIGSFFSSSPTDFTSLIFMSFFIAIFSYVFGLIPALISGFILGNFGGNFYSHKRKVIAATLCMFIASICGLIYIGAADSYFSIVWQTVLMMGGPSFFAGYIVIGMFERSYRFQKIEATNRTT
jgi:hypothetical protein